MSDNPFADFLARQFPEYGPGLDIGSGDALADLWVEIMVLDRPIYLVIDDNMPDVDEDACPFASSVCPDRIRHRRPSCCREIDSALDPGRFLVSLHV